MSKRTNRPIIEATDVTKVYQTRQGPVKALSPTSFDVEDGEFISLLGPSGCGKSTFLMLISGLLPCTDGNIRVGGKDVSKPLTDVGVVFQQDLLMEWKLALDNVLMQGEFRGIPKSKLRPRALELLEMVGLSGFENKYPHELSGGMRQRVSICRALVHEPPLLMMDEPFGALDALTRDQMNLDLQRISRGREMTVFFITHSITEAIFLSDRVLVLSPRPGKIVDDITVDLPRPRHLATRETPEFSALVRRVRERFESMGVIRDDPYENGNGSRPGKSEVAI